MQVSFNIPLESLPFPEAVTFIAEHEWVRTALMVGLLLLVSWVTNLIVKRLLLRLVNWALQSTSFGRDQELRNYKVIPRLANTMPALVISRGALIIPDIPPTLATVISNVAIAFIVLTLAMAMAGLIGIADTLYHRRPESKMRPVKGYAQVACMAVYGVAAILMVSVVTDRSPTILLGSLGAMAAVLLLIFQDTILSFAAGVQILSNDLVRLGDWLEVSGEEADGEVIDIGLHVVKIRNWDNTHSTIPVRKLASEGFKNWRGMQESGGRRIKRCLYIDTSSTAFLSESDMERLKNTPILAPYISERFAEIERWNEAYGFEDGKSVSARRMTNVGTFRAYVNAYLHSRTDIRSDMTLLVRQKPIAAKGLPLEIYCFTATTNWIEYEDIQSDIFEHLYSILPTFGLRAYQDLGGHDLRLRAPGA